SVAYQPAFFRINSIMNTIAANNAQIASNIP
ncbi:unnamed protein product, partial [marine sediment metagenome]